MADAPHTPDRLRAMASLVYRIGASFAAPELREVGDYLASCAAAADQQGDILQQRDAAKAELARLQCAVAEADAARIERDRIADRLAEATKDLDLWKRRAAVIARERDAFRAEIDGQRLWYRLALEWVEELRPLVAPDKQRLIDPMRAAAVASDHRRLIAELVAMLRRLRDWAILYAQTANDPRARADVGDADALLESDPCRRSSPHSKS